MNRLKELRVKKGVTQIELANLLKCSNNTISRYELGERQPDYKTIARLADFYEVTVDYILKRTDSIDFPEKENVSTVLAKAFIKKFKDEFGRDPDESDFARAIRHLRVDAEFRNDNT